MNEELLKQFRREPRKEFADALYEKLAQQASPAPPNPAFSRDGGRADRLAGPPPEELLTDESPWPLMMPRQRSFPLQGALVALVATLLVVFLSTLLIMNGNGLPIRQATDKDAETLMLYINAVWNRGNLTILPHIVTEDHAHHDSSLAEPIVGIEALAAYVAQCRAALPDITFSITQMKRDGDELTASLNATIRETSVPVTARARFLDGRIAETWFDACALTAVPEMKTAVKGVEAANLALAQAFVAFTQDRAQIVQDRQAYLAGHRTLFPPAYLYHDPVSDRIARVSAVNDWKWDRALAASFPDLALSSENIVARGDQVFIHYTSRGTFTQALDCQVVLQPTGKVVEESGMVINRLRNGRIVEQWRYVDNPVIWVCKALQLQKGASDPAAQGILGENQ